MSHLSYHYSWWWQPFTEAGGGIKLQKENNSSVSRSPAAVSSDNMNWAGENHVFHLAFVMHISQAGSALSKKPMKIIASFNMLTAFQLNNPEKVICAPGAFLWFINFKLRHVHSALEKERVEDGREGERKQLPLNLNTSKDMKKSPFLGPCISFFLPCSKIRHIHFKESNLGNSE